MKKKMAWCALGAVLMVGCSSPTVPQSAIIASPVVDATVSGVTPVEARLVSGQGGRAEVQFYLRGAEKTERGVYLGAAAQSPYTVQWNTLGYPNATPLELYPVVGGKAGAAVRVQVRNAGAPQLDYFIGYNLPESVNLGRLSLAGPSQLDAARLSPAPGTDPYAYQPEVALQAANTGGEPSRQFAVEWGWKPGQAGVSHDLQISNGSVAGRYQTMTSRRAGSQVGVTEKVSMFLDPEVTQGNLYGAVRVAEDNRAPLSNAMKATFLPAPLPASPGDGQTVRGGRPVLTWAPVTGASGYVFFLCDQPCVNPDAKFVWTNYPTFSKSLSAVYPSTGAALAPGEYHWWVAAVRYEDGKTVGMSYSEPRRLTVTE